MKKANKKNHNPDKFESGQYCSMLHIYNSLAVTFLNATMLHAAVTISFLSQSPHTRRLLKRLNMSGKVEWSEMGSKQTFTGITPA